MDGLVEIDDKKREGKGALLVAVAGRLGFRNLTF